MNEEPQLKPTVSMTLLTSYLLREVNPWELVIFNNNQSKTNTAPARQPTQYGVSGASKAQQYDRNLILSSGNRLATYNHAESKDEPDHRFSRFARDVVRIFCSPNAHFLCGLLRNGDILMYNYLNKSIKTIHGLKKFDFSAREDSQVELFVADDGVNMIVWTRTHRDEEIWVWSANSAVVAGMCSGFIKFSLGAA